MNGIELRKAGDVRECCAECRRPVELCRSVACDSAGTYMGYATPWGEWATRNEGELSAPAGPKLERVKHRLVAALNAIREMEARGTAISGGAPS